MKFLAIVLSFALGVISVNANAGLIEVDWKTVGDGKVTLDTDTGLAWLDLSQTLAMTVNEVLTDIDTIYSGFRLAARGEVIDLLDKTYLAANGLQLNNYFDNNYYPDHLTSYALYDNGAGNYTMGGFYDATGHYVNYGVYTAEQGRHDFGVYLVSDENFNSVPEPLSLGLFGLGLLGIHLSRRKQIQS